jgi:peptidoglycan/LPS O-acetylase OafA/YrhL
LTETLLHGGVGGVDDLRVVRGTSPPGHGDPAPKRGFRPDVQGLRAVAVVAVVAYHAGFPGLRGGFVGVDVFFVISGFLITGLLVSDVERTGRVSFREFYARRARRILPAAILALLVTLLVSYVVLPPLQVPGAARDAIAAALFVANFRFAAQSTDYLGAHSAPTPYQHYWSLSVEEQFYLFWPALLHGAAALGRQRARAVMTAVVAAVAAGSLIACVWLTHTSEPTAFYLLPTRAWELALGGMIALAASPLVKLPRAVAALLGWAGLAAIVWAVLRYGASTPFPGTAAAVPVLGAAAIIAGGAASGGSARRGVTGLLGTRPMQSLGRVSYSWYLWHWPALVLGAVLLGHSFVVRMAMVALSLGLAHLTQRLVEDPIRHAKRLVRAPRASITAGIALSTVAAVIGVFAIQTAPHPTGHAAAVATPRLPGVTPSTGTHAPAAKAPPSRFSAVDALEQPLQRVLTAAANIHGVPSNLTPSLSNVRADKQRPFLDGCDLSFTSSTSPPCVYGDTAATRTIVAFGDSHAAQWFPALDDYADTKHWRFVDLTKATCPPVLIPIYSPALGREFTECEQWRTQSIARIRAEHPALVIVDAARHYGPEYNFKVFSAQWLSGLAQTVRDLRATGARVLVFGPVAKPGGDVPDCLSIHLDDAQACAAPRGAAVNYLGSRAEQAAVEGAGGYYVPTAPWVCSQESCPVIAGNLLMYRDDNHLTDTYAKWLEPLVAASIDASLKT